MKASIDKHVKSLNQSNTEKIKCTGESGRGKKPEMAGACSILTVSAEYLTEIESA